MAPDGSHTAVNAYLSIGSNIDPVENLRLACAELRQAYGQLRLSHVYRTPAVGFEGPDFLNMVVGLQTDEEPERVVRRMERIHEQSGRVRQANPFCSRTLDIDLLLYGDLVRRRMKLPHGDIEKYAFVLKPLAELAPELQHPVAGTTMRELWDEFERVEKQHMTRVDIGLN